tara:strand:+ start:72617 stop:72820 length:204 start_codon:yes stop_codon:yes gene_type:complete
MMFGYDNLVNWYKTNFNLMQFHKYSLSDLENMIPWERHLYIDLLKDHVKKENDRIQNEKIAQQRQRR